MRNLRSPVIYNGESSRHVNQGNLLEACCDAATARGWHPSLIVDHITGGRVTWWASIDDPSRDLEPIGQASNLEMGFAMAIALIFAHGVTDWDSRAPTS